MCKTIIAAIILSAAGVASGTNCLATATVGLASWYSRESCRREGTGGKQILMANGRPLDDAAMTCALWLTNSAGMPRYPDGRVVTVRNVADGTTVCVAWTDNGPGRVPRSRGVIVDLSKAAMLRLAGPEGLRAGRVRVEVE